MSAPGYGRTGSPGSRTARAIGIAGVLAAAALIAGCGAGTSANTVASVGANTITKAMLDHWVSVVAVRQYESIPGGPVPGWVRPDPPTYAACIDHLEASAGGSRRPAVLAGYKAGCERQYRELRRLVLDSLITGEWLIGEGERRGMRVSDGEERRRLAEVERNAFGGEAKFQRYLALTGETVADQLFRARIKLFTFKIEHQVMASGHSTREGELAFARFINAFPRQWAARTSCRQGYVVPNCKQYKGPVAPAINLL